MISRNNYVYNNKQRNYCKSNIELSSVYNSYRRHGFILVGVMSRYKDRPVPRISVWYFEKNDNRRKDKNNEKFSVLMKIRCRLILAKLPYICIF